MRARPPAFIAASRLALPLLLACAALPAHAQQRDTEDAAPIEAPDAEDADASKVPLAEIRRYVAVYNAVKQAYVEPIDDKKLMQARRAIEKAAGVLRQLDET